MLFQIVFSYTYIKKKYSYNYSYVRHGANYIWRYLNIVNAMVVKVWQIWWLNCIQSVKAFCIPQIFVLDNKFVHCVIFPWKISYPQIFFTLSNFYLRNTCCHTKNLSKSLLSPSSHWWLALLLLINPSHIAHVLVMHGSVQWWTTVALSDLVNHPLISEIVEQSAEFNGHPCSTMRWTIRPVPYHLIICTN